MKRLIRLTRQRGVKALVGEVLPENAVMLQLCREFGFTIAMDAGNPTLRRVSKLLQSPEVGDPLWTTYCA